MKNTTNQQQKLAAKYPKDTRIRIFDDNLPANPKGTVLEVTEEGNLRVRLDNGIVNTQIPGVDKFRKLSEREIEAERRKAETCWAFDQSCMVQNGDLIYLTNCTFDENEINGYKASELVEPEVWRWISHHWAEDRDSMCCYGAILFGKPGLLLCTEYYPEVCKVLFDSVKPNMDLLLNWLLHVVIREMKTEPALAPCKMFVLTNTDAACNGDPCHELCCFIPATVTADADVNAILHRYGWLINEEFSPSPLSVDARRLLNFFKRRYISSGYMYSGMIPGNAFPSPNYSPKTIQELLDAGLVRIRKCDGLAYELTPSQRKRLILKYGLAAKWEKDVGKVFYPNREDGEVVTVMKECELNVE